MACHRSAIIHRAKNESIVGFHSYAVASLTEVIEDVVFISVPSTYTFRNDFKLGSFAIGAIRESKSHSSRVRMWMIGFGISSMIKVGLNGDSKIKPKS